jgi:hypothetical protein
MSRSIIQAMFYPRSFARFQITIELRRLLMLDPNRPSHTNVRAPVAKWRLSIQNAGTATAIEPVVRLITPIEFDEINPALYWPNDSRVPPVFRARNSLHPGDSIEFAGLEYWPKRHPRRPPEIVAFCFDIFCQNQEPQAGNQHPKGKHDRHRKGKRRSKALGCGTGI